MTHSICCSIPIRRKMVILRVDLGSFPLSKPCENLSKSIPRVTIFLLIWEAWWMLYFQTYDTFVSELWSLYMLKKFFKQLSKWGGQKWVEWDKMCTKITYYIKCYRMLVLIVHISSTMKYFEIWQFVASQSCLSTLNLSHSAHCHYFQLDCLISHCDWLVTAKVQKVPFSPGTFASVLLYE